MRSALSRFGRELIGWSHISTSTASYSAGQSSSHVVYGAHPVRPIRKPRHDEGFAEREGHQLCAGARREREQAAQTSARSPRSRARVGTDHSRHRADGAGPDRTRSSRPSVPRWSARSSHRPMRCSGRPDRDAHDEGRRRPGRTSPGWRKPGSGLRFPPRGCHRSRRIAATGRWPAVARHPTATGRTDRSPRSGMSQSRN